MKVLTGTKTVYFDVDNTLVFSAKECPSFLGDTVVIGCRQWVVHEEHRELIYDFKARGHTVVVWSAGGAEWAASVVRALGIEDEVDLCISKPDWYFDDKAAGEWIIRHYYKKGEKYEYRD